VLAAAAAAVSSAAVSANSHPHNETLPYRQSSVDKNLM